MATSLCLTAGPVLPLKQSWKPSNQMLRKTSGQLHQLAVQLNLIPSPQTATYTQLQILCSCSVLRDRNCGALQFPPTLNINHAGWGSWCRLEGQPCSVRLETASLLCLKKGTGNQPELISAGQISVYTLLPTPSCKS